MIVHNKTNWSLILKFSLRNIIYSLTVTLLAVLIRFTLGINSWQIPMAIIATLGTALAIMLGFRNGSAYERWWEARKIWGGLVNDSRSFSRQVLSMIQPGSDLEEDIQEIKAIQKEFIKTHISFLNAHKFQLRGLIDVDYWNKQVFQHLSKETIDGIKNTSNKATQLLIYQGLKLKFCKEKGFLNDFEHMQLDNTLTRFSDHQGKSERIKSTPFPKAYEIFNRILLDLFILFLPFSLLPIFNDMQGWWLVFPVTVLISWVFYGIHEMGLLMAKPFENFRWDVPLDAICNTIEIDLLEACNDNTVPQKLLPNEDGVLM